MRANCTILIIFLACFGSALSKAENPSDNALSGLEAPRESSKTQNELSVEYAFQYRQTLQDRMNKFYQTSLASTRQSDPFGAPMGMGLRSEARQDEGAAQGSEQEQQQQQQMANYGSVLRGLPIRGINYGRKEFLCGNDNVFEGDVLDIQAGNSMYRVWVVSIKPEGIVFMDSSSGITDTISVDLDAPSLTSQSWGNNGNIENAPPF